MNDFIIEDFVVSTAEDEQNYFTGQGAAARSAPSPHALTVASPALYRVMEGRLYLVLPGAPPAHRLGVARRRDDDQR